MARSPSSPEEPATIAVLGVTATGKTAVAIAVADAVGGGEIICADSRTIHRDLTIGSAKPTLAEQAAARHHLLDVADIPGMSTLPVFAAQAETATRGILSRGRVPVVAGGSELYVLAALHHFTATGAGPEDLAGLSVPEIHDRFARRSLPLPLCSHDLGILRATWVQNQVRFGDLRRPTVVLRTETPPADIYRDRVAARVDAMINGGLEAEVAELARRVAGRADHLFSIGYEEWQPLWDGIATRAEVRDQIIVNTLRYAARQERALRRLAAVVPVRTVSGAGEAVEVARAA